MINPKVRAAYDFAFSGDTLYRAFDLSDYENDVKDYVRKLEIYRTDTNKLISSVILTKDKFTTATIGFGAYPADPITQNLPIKAILYINDVVADEHSIDFTTAPELYSIGNTIAIIKDQSNPLFKVKDNTPYPFNGFDIDEYDRFTFVSRRNTTDVSHKLEYIKQIAPDPTEVDFNYTNEFVVIAGFAWFNLLNNHVIYKESVAGSFVNRNNEFDEYYNAGGVFLGNAENDPFANEDLPPDFTKIVGAVINVPDQSIGFTIKKLVDRFEYYATKLKEIKHNPAERRQNRFFHVDLESLQDALTNGSSFPAIYLQTPEVDKNGTYDNMSEQFSFTFVIVDQIDRQTKAQLIDHCKKISDKILNRLLKEVQSEIIPGVIEGSNEGIFGPVGDGLFGWGVSIAISDAYNAEVDANDWEDNI